MNTQLERRSRAGLIGLCALLVSGLCLFAPAPAARGQAAGDGGKSVTLNLQNAPIQTVLRSLFKSAGQHFTIAPNVGGTVNVDVNGVTFQQALDAILSGTSPPLQAPLDNGIYHVGVQPAPSKAPPVGLPVGPGSGGNGGNFPATTTEVRHAYRIPISHYDAAYMSYLVAAFSREGGPPIIVPADPTSGSSSSNNGNNNRNRNGSGGSSNNGNYGNNNNGYGNNGNSNGYGNSNNRSGYNNGSGY